MLEDYFYYDTTSPSFLRWKVDMRSGKGMRVLKKRAGDVAGGLDARGRYVTRLCRKPFLVSRVVWELHNGPIPDDMVVDHVDGDIVNNEVSNLRVVTAKINGRNKKLRKGNNTGTPGVYRRGQKVYAEFTDDLGRHRASFEGPDALDNAVAFRQKAREAMVKAGYTERHINGN